MPGTDDTRGRLLHQLAQAIAGGENRRTADRHGAVSSGCRPLDRLLPGGGFCRGTLVEWLATGSAGGATTLAMLAAVAACRRRGTCVVIDAAGTFYPPAAAAWGLPMERTVVLHPAGDDQQHWAVDQTLRCPAVAAVLAWPESVASHTFRRWQLAAETSGALGLFVRPGCVRREPSWADVRLAVRPVAGGPGRRLQVEIVRCRRSRLPQEAVLELSLDLATGCIDEASGLPLAAELANPAAGRAAQRA